MGFFMFFMIMVPSIAIYINNYPTRCNTKHSIYYSASSLYMFRVSTTPIIRNTQNRNYNLRYWTYFAQLLPSTFVKLAWSRRREVTAQKIWPGPETAVTVLYAPDGGCGWHMKHVEWTCGIINRVLFAGSRWKLLIYFGVLFIFCLKHLSF